MHITDHRLVLDSGRPATFVESPNMNIGETLRPEYLIMHYTAGRDAQSSIRWLTNRAAHASAHLVIGRDGSITQLVAFDRVAWHAGKSYWDGHAGLNDLSLGIEMENYGVLTQVGSHWETWFGRTVEEEAVVQAAHKNGGPVRGWQSYTEAQVLSAQAVATLLVKHYGLSDVLGHDDISPNRKQDPGPAFPMEYFRAFIMGRMEEGEELMITTTRLNIRCGPGITHSTLPEGPLEKGTTVTVLERQGAWRFVDVIPGKNNAPDLQGWVHGRYLKQEPMVSLL